MSRTHPDLQRRQHKRVVNHFMKHVSRTRFFLGCNGHVNKVTRKLICYQEPFSSDVEGTSMVDGSGCACSIMHCAPEAVPAEHVDELVAIFRESDWDRYRFRLEEILGTGEHDGR